MKTLLDKIESGEVEVSVSISFYCVVDREKYDLGAITLAKDNRFLMLDITQSYTDNESGYSEIKCDLEYDEEVSEGYNSDLLEEDLNGLDIKTLFIGDEWEVEPESMTLFVKKNGSTKTIELDMD